jgi:hypothetical protein
MVISTEGSGGALCGIMTAVDAAGFPGGTGFGVSLIS